MLTIHEHYQAPALSADERTSSDLVQRIRKLRWMGMQQEAEELQMTLCRVPATTIAWSWCRATPTGGILPPKRASRRTRPRADDFLRIAYSRRYIWGGSFRKATFPIML